jgi:hypothetical protein
VKPVRIMTMNDVTRLRDTAATSTHLARYELANDRGARRVLDEPCPEGDCGAGPGVQCFGGS